MSTREERDVSAGEQAVEEVEADGVPMDEKAMTIVTFGKYKYFMDNYLMSNLKQAKKEVMKKDYDMMLIIDGPERFGKTTLALQIACFLDPTFCIDRICFTAEQFIKCIQDAKDKGICIVFDEAASYLSSRQALSRFNRALIKCMSEMGFKNLFVIIVLPSFFELDRYPALHRSIGLLHVYSRGCFSSYSYSRKKSLYMTGKRWMSYTLRPDYIARFPKAFPIDYEAYKSKKREFTLQISNMLDKTENRDRNSLSLMIRLLHELHNYTIEELAECLKTSRQFISTLLAEQKEKESDLPVCHACHRVFSKCTCQVEPNLPAKEEQKVDQVEEEPEEPIVTEENPEDTEEDTSDEMM